MSYCGGKRPKLSTRERAAPGVDFSNACDGTDGSPQAGAAPGGGNQAGVPAGGARQSIRPSAGLCGASTLEDHIGEGGEGWGSSGGDWAGGKKKQQQQIGD